MRERSYEIDKAILCTASRPTLHEVRKSSTLAPSTGHKVDLNVRKPSASCPVSGRLPDGFRTLRSGLRPPGAERVDFKWTWWRIRRLAVHRIALSISYDLSLISLSSLSQLSLFLSFISLLASPLPFPKPPSRRSRKPDRRPPRPPRGVYTLRGRVRTPWSPAWPHVSLHGRTIEVFPPARHRRCCWRVDLKSVAVGGRRSWPAAPELARVCATIQPIVKLPTDQRL